MAVGLGSTRWDEEAAAASTAASKLHQAPGCFEASSALFGLVASSMAITLAVRQPPPGLDENAYYLTVSGGFFAGLAQAITAVVCVSNNNPRARRSAGTKLVYAASVAPLVVVVVLSVASLLL
ncbi:unnamed protein product [Urochloa decumbens]|uniref:Uncharacterized protein n=1 Tax=Urochloa decumbens TaxID=240449 RepID=A0ABC9GZK9_9POAL